MSPLDLQAVTYGLSSAQLLTLAWMIFELRAVKDAVRDQGKRMRRVEIACARLGANLGEEND